MAVTPDWTTPVTWNVDQLVTNSDLNTQLKDNISYLYNTHGCHLTHASDVTVAQGVTKTMPFDQESYDPDGMHDTVTDNERITFQTPGKYLLVAKLQINSNASDAEVYIEDDGGNRLAELDYTSLEFLLVTVEDFAEDDWVVLKWLNNSASRTHDAAKSFFLAQRIGS